MHRDNERYRAFSRRAFFLLGGNVVLLSGLVSRMYYLQVIEGERYRTLADENRINLKLLAPPRGRIVDRFGRPLAVNQQNYRLLLIPENIPDINETISLLSQILPITEKESSHLTRAIKRRKRFTPIVFRENLSWREVARIEANALELSGVVIDVGESRFYPHGEATAAILGYVSAVSDQDFDRGPTPRVAGLPHWKSGYGKGP